jgi:hypothetical protein
VKHANLEEMTMVLKRRMIQTFMAVAVLAGSLVLSGQPGEAAKGVKPIVVIDAVTGEGTTAESARLDAFRNAISQAVGVYVQADTVVENYVTKSDKIRTNSKGFIKSFKLLNESKEQGIVSGTYRIEVSTQPLQEDVQDVVGTEFRNVGHPTVSVVGWYKGRNRLEDEVNDFAVTAMNRSLLKRGYKVVDGWLVEKLRKEDAAIVKASGAVQQSNFDQVAQMIANKLKADIYVTTYGSLQAGKASISTKMYNSYTGQIFGSETGYGAMRSGSVADAKAAVASAVTSSMEKTLGQVSGHWQDVLTNGQEYIIVLDGYKDGKDRRTFKKVLEEAEGVTEVKQLNAAGSHAEFSVYSTTRPVDFFDAVIDDAEGQGLKFVNNEAVIRGGRALFIIKK